MRSVSACIASGVVTTSCSPLTTSTGARSEPSDDVRSKAASASLQRAYDSSSMSMSVVSERAADDSGRCSRNPGANQRSALPVTSDAVPDARTAAARCSQPSAVPIFEPVQNRARLFTRSGWEIASSSAMAPPSESPARWNAPPPASSTTPSTASASSAIVNGSVTA